MHGEYKEPGQKLIVVDLDVIDDKLSNVHLGGDFFLEPDEALERYNRVLTGIGVETSVEEIMDLLNRAALAGDTLFGLTFRGIAVAVRRALGKSVSWEQLDFELLNGPCLHPADNMALDEILAEEYMAGSRGPTLRIWQWDRPLLVMGSFQSYANEISPEGTAKHDITVARRITGGGTMFMEPGNCITYSLIVPVGLVDGLSFEASYPYLDEWVMEALEKIGVKARYIPLNDIASEQGKIAGAAQKRFAGGALLHHVTMAYDIDSRKMMECMRIGAEKLRDKGVRSAVKRVDPMRSQTGMAREEIIDVFTCHFQNKYSARFSQLRAEELAEAARRRESKFLHPDWVHRVP